MLTEKHISDLEQRYGIPPERARQMAEAGLLASAGRDEIVSLVQPGREKAERLEGGGIVVRYPGCGALAVRLDVPVRDGQGKQHKYLRPAGQGNRLYVPPGLDLRTAREIWLTEGELKALAASIRGLPCVAVAGVWNWRTDASESDPLAAALELQGEKVPDRAAPIPDLQAGWISGKAFVLWYDSDIQPGHDAWPAFFRLAEQLYRLGASSVRVLSVPSVRPEGKTGLDDYLMARGEGAVAELQALAQSAEEVLPAGDGARPYAERVAADRDAPTAACVRAVAAVMLAEGVAAAEEMAERIDRRRARALLADARKLIRVRDEEEKKRAAGRARRELEEALAAAKQDAEFEKLRQAVMALRCPPEGVEKLPAARLQEEIVGLVAGVFGVLGRFYVDDQQRTYWFSNKEKRLYRMDATEWDRLLTHATGLTDAEVLGSALRKALDAHAAHHGEKAAIRKIAWFDRESATLYLHQYDGRVLRLTGGPVEQVDNGTDGVLFLAHHEWVPWEYTDMTGDAAAQKEAARLFDRLVLGANYDPTSPLSPADAKLVLLTWRLSGFFRSVMPTRPILLLLGETGSGKSTCARLWLRLLYGGGADVQSQPENVKEFQTLTTNEPWTVVDNMDEHVDWLADELARIATGGTVPRRKLYTTNEEEKYPVDTWLTLTARTPRFRRDDVATRILPIRLAPLMKKEPEGRFLREVADPEIRAKVMSYLVLMLDEVVAAFRRDGIPDTDEDLRMADYAAFLRAFLRATTGDREAADARTDSIVAALEQAQAEFLAENDPLLEILNEAVEEGAVPGHKMRAQELYAALAGFCRAKEYDMPIRSPVWLARRLVELGPAAGRVLGLRILTEYDTHAKTLSFVIRKGA